ncbi:MAG: universal stress protein [Methanomassiliicoccus sp.]|nr:universal stress protein [Methanomassiliicoccus sp.]
MFERILFPLDFSEQSLRMLDCLLELKHLGTKEIILCHVVPVGGGLTAEQRTMMDDLRRSLDGAGIASAEIVEQGNPIEKVLDVAKREEVSLIAMASSGKGKTREFLMGSTSFGILRSSTTPVLVNKLKVIETEGRTMVAPACQAIFRKALVPIDFSNCTSACMDLIPQLSELGLKESVLFHVVEGAKANMDDEVKFKRVLDEVMAKLEDLREELEGKGCNASTHVHFGTVSYNILEASRELNISLILLGAHRKSLLRELTLGGNSETVIRRSQVPLLIIPCER